MLQKSHTNTNERILPLFTKSIMKKLFGYKGIIFYSGEIVENTIKIYARHTKHHGTCPDCKRVSTHQHSVYKRILLDLPISGNKVIIIMQVRKYRCKNPKCKRQIFAEQNEEIAKRYSRITNRAMELLHNVLVEMSSQKAAFITTLFCMEKSSSTCLRIVKNMPIIQSNPLTVVGIDDWAKRKGMCYGTIIVNAETKRPIDLLDSRENEDVSAWLKNYPSIKLVTRDRASSYANAIYTGLPEAEQIADKFHIMKNLSEYIATEIKEHYFKIKKTFLHQIQQSEEYGGENQDGKLEIAMKPIISPRTKELFDEIHRLTKQGFSQRAIVRMLHVSRGTIRRYLLMEVPRFKQFSRSNNYSCFFNLVKEYYEAGMSMNQIYYRIVGQGFNGKPTAFRKWFHLNFPEYNVKNRIRNLECKILNNQKGIKVSMLSYSSLAIHTINPQWGISKKTGEYSERHILAEQIIASSDMLKEMREAYLSFQKVLSGDVVTDLYDWISNHESTSLKYLKSFIRGLHKDINAVCNAIKYKWTNGLVEGEVNRLKNKKREMYGRGSFQLLRRKVVLSVTG